MSGHIHWPHLRHVSLCIRVVFLQIEKLFQKEKLF